jgi:hypothetical protein
MSYKYLDIYVNNLGNVLSTDFPEEPISQYSNNFFIRVLAIDNYFDTVTIDILQPNGTTLSKKQAILSNELVNGYYAWQYRLSQLDTSIAMAPSSQLQFTIFLNIGESIITSAITSKTILPSINSEVVVGDPTSLNNIAENINELSADFIELAADFDEIITTGGVAGPAGQAATITVGSTTTSIPGGNASVNNSGTSTSAVLNFVIPRGSTGPAGPQGIQGIQGPIGLTPQLEVGSVLTGQPGSNAVVSISGTTLNPLVNFTIPRGEVGAAGIDGTDGTDGTDGREVLLRNDSGFVQWKYETDANWNNLVSIASLQGPQGESVELRATATHIQFKYPSQSTWTNLIALSVITGPQGIQGPKGDKGDPGMGFFIEGVYSTIAALLADTITIGHFGLVTGLTPSDEDNGKLYLFTDTGWQYMTDISVQGIQGPQGIQGIQGPKGDKGDPGDITNFATTSPITANISVGAIDAGSIIPTGTTLQEFIEQLLIATFFPTLEAPSFSLSSNLSSSVEAGTTSNLLLTANFNRGAIRGTLVGGVWSQTTIQNPRAGAATGYVIEDNNLGLTNSLTINNNVIADGANTYDAQVFYAQGAQPLDSTGANFQLPLASGTLTASTTITGFRRAFYGTSNQASTSAQIRAFQNSVNNPQNGTQFTIIIPSGTNSVEFAYPASLRDVTSVMQIGIFDVKAAFTQTLVNVEGANGFLPIQYKVYRYVPDVSFNQQESYEVTI